MTAKTKQHDRLTRRLEFRAPTTGTFYRVWPANPSGACGVDIQTRTGWVAFGELEEGDGSLSRLIEAAERMVEDRAQA